jgi:DNA-binding MurR/RpiR family transcriptional regulator
MESEPVIYFTSSEAAERLGCSVKTVTRAARRAGIGVFVHGGNRLAALHPTDLKRMQAVIHATSGNPDWIAAAKARSTKKRA